MSTTTPASASSLSYTAERADELKSNLADIRSRIHQRQRQQQQSSSSSSSSCTLIAVSKYKPASDVLACHTEGSHLDFGENYVQELVEKAAQLPLEIRWHFIGTLQSNKAKILAAIPNLHTIQTLTSTKAASALQKSLPPPPTRTSPLNILLQVNTSGEASKSGLSPLSHSEDNTSDEELTKLARHILDECPRLRLQGLMTIGALERSLSASATAEAGEGNENEDFERLVQSRDVLEKWLRTNYPEEGEKGRMWGDEKTGKLVLSMGMSSDFEAAIAAGSDIVRVGTGIFGARPKK